ncbi:MAG: cadherin-like beta sandwich domain-containing protein [Mesorhizobium sp.]|nr:cadherin-like beta sandwich domain-containing protein [Mesorhizobium sp.]
MSLTAMLLLPLPNTAFAAPSVYCPTLNATVANGGSVMIDVSACDGPFDGGMSGPIAPFAQHGTVTIGSNSGGTQFVTYAHSGDAATSDQFALEDNDLGVVTVNITIDPPVSPITVSPGSLPSMTAGTAFSQSLSATGGTAPYTYSLQSGSLPVGISLTSGGLLSGTPTQRGGYAFAVRATDNIGQVVDKGYTGTVLNPTLSIAPTSATAIQGIALSQTIFASGGVGPYTFAVESGLLPVGISLSSSGLLSGTTSSAPGSYPLMLRVTDSSTGPGVYFELENFTLTVAPAPSVSISVSPASVSEDGAGNLVYTVTRSQNLSSSTIVNLGYTGSADASDYTGETLTVTIPSGSTSGIVVINPSADVTVEADETVIVSIQSGTGYTIGAPSSATGTILNDDLGTLTINNVTIPEGDSGTQTVPFTISLSQPAGPSGVTFDITTANGTATAGEDYEAKSILGATIAPGGSTYSFNVDVYGDTTNEPNEIFLVNITNVTNAILGDGQGAGTIVNDDLAGPSITNISPNNGPEAGGTSVTITGTNFTGATAVTFGGTAAASFAVNSSTTISAVTPAGTAGAVDVAVTTPGGTNTETGGFTYTAGTLPELSIDDVTVGENGVNASFTITLSAPAGPGGVTFDLTTADGTAVAGDDYYAFNGSGFIPEGEDTYYHGVGVISDAIDEPDETFFLDISNVVGATLVKARGTATINDDAPTITVAPANLSDATVGAPYSATVTASGGTGPYTYAVTVGALPGGLTLTSSGTLSGTPTAEGTFNFTITATDSSGGNGPYTGSRAYTIAVAAPTVTVSPATLPAATVAASYSQSLTASGGTAPYSYAVTAGALPSGMNLSSVGVLSGTPTAGGTFNFTITATDDSGGIGPHSGSRAYTLTVAAPVIALSPATLPTATQGVAYAQTVTASGGTAPYTYSITGGSLPPSIGMSSAGAFSGTPTANGTFNFTVTATDSSTGTGPFTGSQAYSLQVNAGVPPMVTSVSVPANGSYRAGDVLSFVVNFNESIVVDTSGGTPSVPVTIGATTSDAYYLSGSGSNALVFRHTVNPGELDTNGIQVGSAIELNGGTIANTSATPADLALNNVGSTSGVLVDAVAPTVLSSAVSGSPLPDATTADFSVTFAEPVTGVDASDFSLTTSGAVSGTISGVATADNITYVVSITGISGTGSLRMDVLADGSISDGAGNAMVTAYTAGTPWVRGGSADATLSNLTASAGTLAPSFDPPTTAYAVAVDSATDSITLTPTAADANATIAVEGQVVASGSASQQIALAVGPTPIAVVVTAEDGATTQTYTVTVTRAASTDATLASLAPSSGSLDPAFDPATTTYAVAVDNSTDSLTLTPTTAEPNASITVGGQAVTSGNASQPLALAVGATAIPVVVTAEDGLTTLTYTVTVTRAASADATLASLTPSAGTLDPAFDPATTGYDVAVNNAIDNIALTPTVAGSNASITVDGQSVVSGSGSQSVALAVGSTVIPVVVTAEDGVTTQTYTVTVTRAASADATLASLTPSAGTLDPAFSPSTAAYAIAVDNSTDSIALTPTAAEPNVTITVNGQNVVSGSASQAIALAVGSTVIEVVVTAGDGTTTRTYTVTVTRAASSNAKLASLTPSVGALDPGFNPDSFDYAVAVANAVDSIALTPTADDANAMVTVNGQSVTSGGVSQAIALPVGSTAISVVVTAGDGTTTRTYTVTAMRAQPVPTVVSREIEINAGETASVDLTQGATGGPFTDAAIVDLSDADAGSARIERDGQTYRLVFASSSTYAGGADVRFTLSNATGMSAPGTIAFTIVGRPNPAQDPEVIGLLNAQTDAARRFAQAQTQNFNDRLEQLHDEGDRRRSSMNLSLGYNAKEKRGDREIQQLVERAHDVPGLLGYASTSDGRASGDAFGSNAEPEMPNGSGGMDLGAFAVWTGGYINFGESDDGALDLDHTMVGVSAGVDYRFSPKFVAGFGVGFGRDRTDVGDNGTQSTGHAYSAAIYGSYKPFDNFFLDGLVGGSWLDFDSRRYVSATGDFANGSRSGHQLFGSLTAAYEFRDDTWLLSPYGRVELSRTWLDGFAEEGGGDFGLRYGDQSIDTVSGVIGLRAQYAFKMPWGTLKPGARIEYTHDFAGSSRINLGYIDLDHLPYWLEIEPSKRNYVTLGLSLDADLPQDWTLGFDYRTAFGSDQQDHAFGLQIGKRF